MANKNSSEAIRLAKYQHELQKAATNDKLKTKILTRIITFEDSTSILKTLISFDPSLIANIKPELLTDKLEEKHQVISTALTGFGVLGGTINEAKKFYSILPKGLKHNPTLTTALLDANPEIFKLDIYEKNLTACLHVADKATFFEFIPKNMQTNNVVTKALTGRFPLEAYNSLTKKHANNQNYIKLVLENDAVDWSDANIEEARSKFLNNIKPSKLKPFINDLVNLNPRLLFTTKNVKGEIEKQTIIKKPLKKENQELFLRTFQNSLNKGNHAEFAGDLPRKKCISFDTISKMIDLCQTKDLNNNLGVQKDTDTILGFMRNLQLEKHNFSFKQSAKLIEQALLTNSDVLKVIEPTFLENCMKNRKIGNRLLALAVSKDPEAVDYAQRPLTKRQSFMVVKSCLATMANPNSTEQKVKTSKQILSHFLGIEVEGVGQYQGKSLGTSKINKKQLKQALKTLCKNNPEFLAECILNPEISNMPSFKKLLKSAIKVHGEKVEEVLNKNKNKLEKLVETEQTKVNNNEKLIEKCNFVLNVFKASETILNIANLEKEKNTIYKSIVKAQNAISKTEKTIESLEEQRAQLIEEERKKFEEDKNKRIKEAVDKGLEPPVISPFDVAKVGLDIFANILKLKSQLKQEQKNLDSLNKQAERLDKTIKAEGFVLNKLKNILNITENSEIKKLAKQNKKIYLSIENVEKQIEGYKQENKLSQRIISCLSSTIKTINKYVKNEFEQTNQQTQTQQQTQEASQTL